MIRSVCPICGREAIEVESVAITRGKCKGCGASWKYKPEIREKRADAQANRRKVGRPRKEAA